MMFFITEIHPFLDGNGRIARIMMNAELLATKQSKIIIPTVYREDYLLALKKASQQNEHDAYVNMLLHAQQFSAHFDFSDYQHVLQQLRAVNAFLRPHEGKLLL